MNKKISAFLIVLFTITLKIGVSQTTNDTILLLNGNTVIANIIDTLNNETTFKDPKNEKKNLVIENDRIFSIKNNKGESLVYVFDTTIGNEFTIQEMRYFIKGEQDADKGFKASGSFWGNVAVGAGAGVTGFFFCPIAPFVFTAFVGIPKVKIKKKTVSNIENLKENSYLQGYERVAKKKRKIRSLIGGGLGLGVGLGAFAILKSNGEEVIK